MRERKSFYSTKNIREHIKRMAKKVKKENVGMKHIDALNAVARLMGYTSYKHVCNPPKESYNKKLTKIIIDDIDEQESQAQFIEQGKIKEPTFAETVMDLRPSTYL